MPLPTISVEDATLVETRNGGDATVKNRVSDVCLLCVFVSTTGCYISSMTMVWLTLSLVALFYANFDLNR